MRSGSCFCNGANQHIKEKGAVYSCLCGYGNRLLQSDRRNCFTAWLSEVDFRSMMIKNPILRNTLSALAILVSIPIMLTLLFLLYALIFNLYDMLIPLKPDGPNPYFIIRPITLFVILAVLAWFIFRLKIATLYKAIYTTWPVATVMAFVGIYFEHSPILTYSLCALFAIGILGYLFFTKKSWFYYISVIPVSIALLLVKLLGVEI